MMQGLFWSCLFGGLLFALVTIIFGDIFGDLLGDVFQPMVLVSGITVFGAAGILLTRYTLMNPIVIVVLSIAFAISISIIIYFAYIRPMKNSENSIAYSMQDLVGLTGEVSVAIPAQGYGEVILKVGAGYSNHIALSYSGKELPIGTKIFVTKVENGVVSVVSQN